MFLKEFSYISDENINPSIIKYLRDKSFNIKDVREEKLIGTSDSELMKLSFKENRVIITQDRDFGKLVYTQNSEFIGIIYLRPGHIAADFHIKTFEYLLNADLDLVIPFIIVAENLNSSIKIRLRSNLNIQ
jgi:predicted nuclease of predicted toxin-antitoxin system